jgi:D-xylose transport system substrate-binding protein
MNARIGLVVVSLVLSVLIGLVVARGGAAPQAGGKDASPGARSRVLIGLSLDTLKEARWQEDRRLFLERARELGADVLDLAANSDDTVQISDVEKLITSRVDVLVIVPHDGKAMAKGVAMAKEAGIPVIAYDRMIRDADVDLYLSFDNVRVGELQARFVVDHLPTPGRGRIVRVFGAKTDHNAHLFKAGQDNVLGPYLARGDVSIIHEDWAEDWKPESAKKILNAAITAHGSNFDAVLASNDGTAGGAIQALLEEGLAGKKVVTGQDAELVACQRVVAGSQSMTIYKPLRALARAAAEAAVSLAKREVLIARSSVENGKKAVPSILKDVVVVTQENMESTVVREGFHSRADVYKAAATP